MASFGRHRHALALSLLLLPDVLLVQGRQVEVVQSFGETGDRLAQKDSLTFGPDFNFDGPTLKLSSITDQEIIGFGGAFTEAASLVFKALPEAEKNYVLEAYFGETGIGLTIGRTHINSCDFSVASYSFDDVEDDMSLRHFDREVKHDTEAMIPFIKAAQKTLNMSGRQLKLLATPWSPPGWMKTNGVMAGTTSTSWFPQGWETTGWLKNTCRNVWARYFSKFITAYKAHGIPIWAVTPQNEPENPAEWEGCVYSPEEEMDFVANELGPTLARDHPEVKILVYDHNKDHIEQWAKALQANPGAAHFTAGLAFHWYTGDSFDNVAKVHQELPDTILLATEASFEKYRWKAGSSLVLGDWSNGLGYAHDILGDLNAGASGWIDWNLLVDAQGGPNHVDNDCDAAMIVQASDVYIHPQYYALGHFSKFVLPGSRRLKTAVLHSRRPSGSTRPYGTCTEEDGLEAAAFLRPDGKVAAVLLNCGDRPMDAKIQDGSEALSVRLPGQSMQTYLFEQRSSVLFT